MAINGVITNVGVQKAQQAQNNEGFLIFPQAFGVSDTVGPLDVARTSANAQWFNGPISTRVVIDQNTIKFVCTIPPGATAVNRTIREIYIFCLDVLNNQFLLAIGQPSTPITYDPAGSTTLELQLSLMNADIAGNFVFLNTMATELAEHRTDPNSHPEIIEALNKAGLFFNLLAGPVPFAYRGQNFDERAEWQGTKATATHGGVVFTAKYNGPDGNLISLVFDGVMTVDEVRLQWNNANPYNPVEHNGVGTEVPVAAVVGLAGGTIAVSDGDVVYRDVDGIYKQALGDGTIKSRVAGIADMSAPIKRVVRASGFVKKTTGFAIGTEIYLSASVPGAMTDVAGLVKLGHVIDTDTILIGTGGGSGGGGVGAGYDAVVTDAPGYLHFTTTQAAIAAVDNGGRILVDKLEDLLAQITVPAGKRIDFHFNGPEAGWRKYVGNVESQKITFSAVPTSGTWRIEWNAQQTTDLAFNCTATDVQNAINALSGTGLPVTVTGDFSVGFTISWSTFDNVGPITFLDGGLNEIQTIALDNVPDNGTVQLDFDGQLTANFAWNDNAAMLEGYLEALSNLADVQVTGSFASQLFTVEFVGADGLAPKNQMTVNANSLALGLTPTNVVINTTQQGRYPASNLKNGLAAVTITVQTLAEGTAEGPNTAIQVGDDYTRFSGLGKIHGFVTGIDLNGKIGCDVEMLFSSTTTPIAVGAVTPGSDLHHEKSFGIVTQKVRTVGATGDHPTLWAAVTAASDGDKIVVFEDQTLTSAQTIDKDIEIVFAHKSQINVTSAVVGVALTLGSRVRTQFLRMVVTGVGITGTAIKLSGDRGYHEDMFILVSGAGVTVTTGVDLEAGASAQFLRGAFETSGGGAITTPLANSSGSYDHDVVIRDVTVGLTYVVDLRGDQDRGMALVRGGVWSWTAGTGQLTFNADAYIQIPGLAENRNQIALASSPITLANDGEVAYVVVNRSSGVAATLAVSVAAIASVVPNPDLFIIARRVGNDVIIGDGLIRLGTGESQQLQSGLSNETLLLIGGSTTPITEATSDPTWATRGAPLRTVQAADSILDAIAGMDDEIDKFFGQLRITPHGVDGSRVIISGADVTMLDGSTRSQVISDLLMDFDGAQVDFDTGTVFASNGVTVLGTFTVPAVAASQYRWAAITLLPNTLGPDNRLSITVDIQFGLSDGASAAIAPRAAFSTGFPIGAVYIQRNVADTGFEDIASANIYQLGIGSGSGGSGESQTRTPADGYQAMVHDGFAVAANNTDSKVNDSLTSGTYSPKHLYEMKCDKTLNATTTGLNFSLSGAPAGFSLAVGNVLYDQIGGLWRRVATVATATTGTLDAAFPVDLAGTSCMVAQAVWTKDLVNIGDATEKTRLRDMFPSTDVLQINVAYADSLAVNDTVPDYVDIANVVMAASNYGLQTDVTYPDSDKFTTPFTRAALPGQILDYVLSDFGNKERLFLVFFPNPANGSVTTQANLIEYEASLYQETTYVNGGVLASAFCMTDGTGTPNNCSNPTVVGGKTRIALGFNFIPSINQGQPDGDLVVELEGLGIPRYFPGVVGAYFTEVAGSTNEIDLHTDLSGFSYSVKVSRRQGQNDGSIQNALRLAALQEAIVGTPTQVGLGQATHSSVQAAHDAMGSAGKILMLIGTITENVVWTKSNVTLEGKGRGSVLSGSLTLNNGAVGNIVRALKVTGNVSFSAGADGNFFSDAWVGAGSSLTDSGAGNVKNYIQET